MKNILNDTDATSDLAVIFYLESITIQIGYIYRNAYLLCRSFIYFRKWSLEKSILHIY